ncbi:hypothetical protein ACQ86G_07115 [Roseateles chitinivorans]|uniref:hypothetical protein n=1 Tax=Roseateles chitinivorans TaxID=2917965 RepID=UPI003D672D52
MKSRQTGWTSVFSIEILQRGASICGRADATSTEKIDFTWFVGRVEQGVAVVAYTSNFYLEDVGRGTADIRVTPHGLTWQAREPSIRGYIWSDAKVRRQAWGKGRRALVAEWCASHWADIDAGRTDDIVLRETEAEVAPAPDPFAVPPKE